MGASDERPLLFFMGGSLGAKEINHLLEPILPMLSTKFDIAHQCGEHYAKTPLPDNIGPGRYIRKDFFADNFPHILAASSLVVCRAGSSTIWELAALRKPAILIPLRGAGTRGDQIRNAQFYSGIGAAAILQLATSSELMFAIEIIMENHSMRDSMKQATEKLPAIDASSNAAQAIERHLSKNRLTLSQK